MNNCLILLLLLFCNCNNRSNNYARGNDCHNHDCDYDARNFSNDDYDRERVFESDCDCNRNVERMDVPNFFTDRRDTFPSYNSNETCGCEEKPV